MLPVSERNSSMNNNNTIFDTEAIIIKEPAGLSYLRLDEYLNRIGDCNGYETKENGDEIFYVDCPNNKNHNSDGLNHSMIFHQYGEKDPYFYCVHSQCEDVTIFDYFDSKNVDYTAYLDDNKSEVIEPIKVSDKRSVEELKRFIVFHGYEPEGYHVFSSSDSYQFIRLKPSEMHMMNIVNLFGDEELLGEFFPLEIKGLYKGVDYQAVGKWLINESKRTGVFRATSLKPLGVHMEEDRPPILNTGTHVFYNNSKYDFFDTREQFKGFYLPSSNNNIVIPDKELSQDSLKELFSLVEKLPFKTNKDRVIFCGVMFCGLIPGGIEIRPSMWVTGKGGCGKTSILELVLVPIWKAAGAINIDVGSTGPGIEQETKGQNVSIIFDEAESNTRTGIERISTILEGAKASTTIGTGVTLKGSSGGRAVNYKHKSCYCFSSVGNQINNDTIVRRVFTILIQQQEHHKKDWNFIKMKLKRLITKKFTQQFFLFAFNRIPEFNKNVLIVEEYLVKTSIPSSIIGMWISIITAYLMMLGYKTITPNDIEKELSDIIAQIIEENQGESAENNNAIFLLEIILNSQVNTEDNKKVYISDLIQISMLKSVDIGISITQDKANQMLSKLGLKMDKNNLYIHTKHDFLLGIFEKRNISGYASRLSTYPEAKKSGNAIRFYTSRNRALIIPLPEDLIDSPQHKEIESYTGNIPEVFDKIIKIVE